MLQKPKTGASNCRKTRRAQINYQLSQKLCLQLETHTFENI